MPRSFSLSTELDELEVGGLLVMKLESEAFFNSEVTRCSGDAVPSGVCGFRRDLNRGDRAVGVPIFAVGSKAVRPVFL